MTPPKGSSREDRLELHREKMRNKAARRVRWHKAVADDRARVLAQTRFDRIPRYNSTAYILRKVA